jgi:photosystem II stability/assembly factor-like uncharacterized protein
LDPVAPWTRIDLPAPPDGEALHGIWGTGGSDLYAVGAQTVWHSSDGGQTWTHQIPQPTSDGGYGLAISGSSSSDVYVAGGQRLWHSTDDRTWSSAQVATDIETLWAGGTGTALTASGDSPSLGSTMGYWVERSADGLTWTEAFRAGGGGLEWATDVLAMWGDGRGLVVAVGTQGDVGVFDGVSNGPRQPVLLVSTDGGASWRDLADPNGTKLEAGLDDGIASVWGMGSALVAACPRGLFRSTDQGMTWSAVDPMVARAVGGDDQTFYAVGARGAVRRSTDGGLTWTVVPTGVELDLDAVWVGNGVYVGGTATTGAGSSRPVLLHRS